jgi:predicted RNA binding protein YcfA (HicA-like mRNA interferase family)
MRHYTNGVKQVSGKEFVRLLQHHGRRLKRISGSHHIFTKPGNQKRLLDSFLNDIKMTI